MADNVDTQIQSPPTDLDILRTVDEPIVQNLEEKPIDSDQIPYKSEDLADTLQQTEASNQESFLADTSDSIKETTENADKEVTIIQNIGPDTPLINEPEPDIIVPRITETILTHSNLTSLTLEPKPTSAPPLLLLESEAKQIEVDSVFSGDLSQMPDQLLAETADPSSELDERTENDIASNIEDQLREFEGSEDECILSKEKSPALEDETKNKDVVIKDDDIFDDDVKKDEKNVSESAESKVDQSDAVNEDSNQPDISVQTTNESVTDVDFEEVDVSNIIKKEKSLNADDNDVLSDDRTQAIESSSNEIETQQKSIVQQMEDEEGEDSAEILLQISTNANEKTPEIANEQSLTPIEIMDDESQQTGKSVDSETIPKEEETKESEDSVEVNKTQTPMEVDEVSQVSEVPSVEEVLQSTENADISTEEAAEDAAPVTEPVKVIENENPIPTEDEVSVKGRPRSRRGLKRSVPSEQKEDDDEDVILITDTTDKIPEKRQSSLRKSASGGSIDGTSGGNKSSTIIIRKIIQTVNDPKKKENITNAIQPTRTRRRFRNLDDGIDETALENYPNKQTESTNNIPSAATTNDKIQEIELNELDIKELTNDSQTDRCLRCRKVKDCRYKLLRNGSIKYLCELNCVNRFRLNSKEKYNLIARKIIVSLVFEPKKQCVRCKTLRNCRYRYKDIQTGNYISICDAKCYELFVGANIEKYFLRRKIYLVEELAGKLEQQLCIHCDQVKSCKYSFKQDDEVLYICQEDCFNLLAKEEPERFKLKRRSVRVRDLVVPSTNISTDSEPKIIVRSNQEAETARLDRVASFLRRCAHCAQVIETNDKMLEWETVSFCNELCLESYQKVIGSECANCTKPVPNPSLGKYCVRFGFEIRQFCCASCLDIFKRGLKVCSFCQKDINKDKDGFLAPVGDNKTQFKDFCSRTCLKKYDEICNPRKKQNIELCAVCNNEKQIKVEILLDSKEYFFCSNPCFSAFKFVNNIFPDQCTMCWKYFERKSKESYTIFEEKSSKVFCGKICMNIYIILNRKIVPCQCCKVKKYNFDMIQKQDSMLCSLNCLNLCEVSINSATIHQKFEKKCDSCNRLANSQYHLTMSDATIRNFCTYQCVVNFQDSHTPIPDESGSRAATNKNKSPFPVGLPKKIKYVAADVSKFSTSELLNTSASTSENMSPPSTNTSVEEKIADVTPSPPTKLRKGRGRPAKTKIIDSSEMEDDQPLVQIAALAKKQTTTTITTRRSGTPQRNSSDSPQTVGTSPITRSVSTTSSQTNKIPKKSVGIQMEDSTLTSSISSSEKFQIKTQLITVPPIPPIVSNKQTMCKPTLISKGVQCHMQSRSIECQTDDSISQKLIIPIPVPIYVPQPMYMYSAPFPVPVPIPLPIPVPIFIPTTRNSAEGILKEIKKIQDKMPTDPFEAELLMMAEMVAGDKKKNESDSDSDDDQPATSAADDDYTTEIIEPANNNSFGEDVLQIALKMATEYDEPAVDLESAMTATTITPPAPISHISTDEAVDDPAEIQHHQMILIEPQRQSGLTPSMRGRKRTLSPTTTLLPRHNRLSTISPNKRIRRQEIHQQQQQSILHQQPEPIRDTIPIEKPDANMCLKYTFGVNAWKQWVMTKNADLEKSTIRRKPFKSELLQLTADELNYSLCLFVKEVRKPNGSEYAPDTIYYLVLGIQQYLYENGRIDNIFTDPYYERFTDCLDEVAKRFSILYNDSQYIVTRVEEEHLWECKQLGAHSPHVLLSTLMFFNTKHFNLTTVEEHMQLSFSHIMKHWKRSPPGTKTQGTRNVLLRFYPPQTGPDANPRKKKVYEQQENELDPLRCPVKLYEFYLSKCPESVKTRNDVFYLQPERSCVPDSPVWYSTQPLSREALNKMLHRVKMVKEINIALLSS